MYCGIYRQPVGSLTKWVGRGINLFMGSETEGGKVSQSDWRKAARALGVSYYDVPSADIDADAKDPFLLGWMADDEADRRLILPAINALKKETDPAKRASWQKQIDDCVGAWMVQAQKLRGKGKPILANFSGPDVTGGYPWYKGDAQKLLLPYCDEISADWYCRTKDLTRYLNTLVGQQIDLLKQWNHDIGQPEKPLWVCLECSDQKLSATGGPPSPQDMEDQLGEALKRGCKGVVYFPQKIGGGFAYDNLADPQLSKLVEIAKRLNPPVVPPVVAKTIAKVVVTYSDGTSTTLP